MEEQQIRELLDAMKGEILNAVDAKNSGLAASLSKEIKKIAAPAAPKDEPEGVPGEVGEGKLSLKALQSQLAAMKGELDAERASALDAERGSAIANAVAASGANAPAMLAKILRADYMPSLKREGESWFVDGDEPKELGAVVKDFLASPDGAIFLPASGTRGTGAAESKSAALPDTSKAGLSAANFAAAFDGI